MGTIFPHCTFNHLYLQKCSQRFSYSLAFTISMALRNIGRFNVGHFQQWNLPNGIKILPDTRYLNKPFKNFQSSEISPNMYCQISLKSGPNIFLDDKVLSEWLNSSFKKAKLKFILLLIRQFWLCQIRRDGTFFQNVFVIYSFTGKMILINRKPLCSINTVCATLDARRSILIRDYKLYSSKLIFTKNVRNCKGRI